MEPTPNAQATDTPEKFSLNYQDLQAFQQNRYPFLLIDHVDEVIPGKSARGYKLMTLNEWYFPVHFPGAPNMPGALQIEAMAQMLTVAITTLPDLKGRYTRALDYKVRFRKEVVPGKKFDLEAEVLSWRRGICKGYGIGRIDGEVACEGELLITIPEILEQFTPPKKTG
ncbi:beta-hydroxyacyl-ACP dehydratase [Paraburkholderia sp. PREW-6R]|uniref:beta-hydroxyacyl-ACP dehydratase n=1 Tax=Paraburkholderia sp. PREW-6R TaxID=3141544 RepID=UPI0031F4D827